MYDYILWYGKNKRADKVSTSYSLRIMRSVDRICMQNPIGAMGFAR